MSNNEEYLQEEEERAQEKEIEEMSRISIEEIENWFDLR